MNLADELIHDNFQPKIVFGKLFFAVAPFLNNSQLLADPALSGIVLSCSFALMVEVAILYNLHLLFPPHSNGLDISLRTPILMVNNCS
jgi:hypothetical protein